MTDFNISVIDDESELSELLSRILHLEGHIIKTVKDGLAAIKIIEKNFFM